MVPEGYGGLATLSIRIEGPSQLSVTRRPVVSRLGGRVRLYAPIAVGDYPGHEEVNDGAEDSLGKRADRNRGGGSTIGGLRSQRSSRRKQHDDEDECGDAPTRKHAHDLSLRRATPFAGDRPGRAVSAPILQHSTEFPYLGWPNSTPRTP